MTMQSKHSFGIRDWKDFLQTLQHEVELLREHPGNSAAGIRCATFGWQIIDWLWAHRFNKNDPEQLAVFNVAFSSKGDFVAEVVRRCPDLEILQEICNGTKHAKTTENTVAQTGVQLSFSSQLGIAQLGVMGLGRSGPDRLVVVLRDGTKRDYWEIVDNVLRFWNSL